VVGRLVGALYSPLIIIVQIFLVNAVNSSSTSEITLLTPVASPSIFVVPLVSAIASLTFFTAPSDNYAYSTSVKVTVLPPLNSIS